MMEVFDFKKNVVKIAKTSLAIGLQENGGREKRKI